MPVPDDLQTEIDTVYREFKRYTGDGLPGEPTGAPLPVGDPQSGPHSPKKSRLRAFFASLYNSIAGSVAAYAEAAAESASTAQEALDEILGIGVSAQGLAPFASVHDLVGYAGTATKKAVVVRSYYPDNDVGGGTFYWEASRPKSDHNGGTVISPTVPWDGTRAGLLNFLDRVGETDASGSGCWVRKNYMILNVEDFGAHPSLADNQKPIQAALLHGRNGVVMAGYGLRGFEYATTPLTIYTNTKFVAAEMMAGRLQMIQVSGYDDLITYGRVSGDVAERVINVEISGFVLVGQIVSGEKRGAGIAGKNFHYCHVHHNEIANFNQGFRFNSGAVATNNEAYINRVSQNNFASCSSGISLQGAANRNTFETNSYTNCGAAYDFSTPGNVSETNCFINESVEGCQRWAFWDEGGAIFSQTWIGLTVENPTTNEYTCIVRDPGRQVFVNLSLIPANDGDGTSLQLVPGKKWSLYLGSQASSDAGFLGLRLNEKLMHASFTGSRLHTSTLAAHTGEVITEPVAGALPGDIVKVGVDKDIGGCTFHGWVQPAGTVNIRVYNPESDPYTMTNVTFRFVVESVL